MHLQVEKRINITFQNCNIGFEKDKEILQKKNEELIMEKNKLSEDLRKMKSDFENKEILLRNNEELIKEKNKLSENLLKMKSDFADKEKDFDRKIEEILKQKTEILLNEKEKEFSEKVKALEPILNETLEFNERLRYQVKYLEEAVKEKDKNLLIFQDRNYQSEVHLSKIRGYIQHRERKFNEEFNSLNIDFMSRIIQMKSAKSNLKILITVFFMKEIVLLVKLIYYRKVFHLQKIK